MAYKRKITQYPKTCKVCGNHFIARGANAKYCPHCALMQKKISDDNRWERRKRQQSEEKLGLLPEMVGDKYEELYRTELGLSKNYYSIFKNTYPKIYVSWIKDQYQKAQSNMVSKAEKKPL